jgi:ferredoxin-NADP reductase
MTRVMTPATIDGRPVGTAAGAMHLRVDQVRWEAQDVVSIRLARPDGAELPAWRSGTG